MNNEMTLGVDKVEKYNWTMSGEPGEMVWIDKNQLLIDHRYQRQADDPKVLRLAREWDWSACGCITVARRDSGKYYVPEGQHRVLAALKRSDINKLPCYVVQSTGQKEEAGIFLKANGNRKPVSAVQKFRALIVQRNPHALLVERLVKMADRKVSPANTPDSVACVTAMLKYAESHSATLIRLWPMIIKLCEGHGINNQLLHALVYIESRISGYDPAISLTDEYWSNRIYKLGVPEFMRKIGEASAYHAKGGERVWAEGVLIALNRGLRPEKYLRVKNIELSDNL